MRTPGHDLELAAGFLLTEGIIQSQAQISNICSAMRDNGTKCNTVEIELQDADFDRTELQRNFFAASSCGGAPSSNQATFCINPAPYSIRQSVSYTV